MTDLFAAQGITFESAGMASSHPEGAAVTPSAGQPSMPKPDVNIDSAPIVSNAPKGNANMSPDDKRQAMSDLYGDGAAPEESAAPSAQPSAPAAGQSTPRDLFAEQGIVAAPSITDNNQSALTAGIPLTAPAASGDWTPPSKSAMSQPDFGDRQVAGDTDAARAAKIANDTRQSAISLGVQLFGQQQVNDWIASPIGAVEGVERAVSKGETLPFVGDSEKGALFFRLKNIADKRAAGEPLTADDQNTVNTYLHDSLEESIRGFTRGGKVAYSIVQIPAWVYEYAAGDGAAKFALGGVKLAAPALDSIAHMATTSAFMPAQYVPAYAERQFNASTALTDKGELIAKQSTESPAKSALMAYGFVNADVASMMAGPGINKYIVEPTTKLLSTPIISAAEKLPPELRESIYQAYRAVDPNASYSKLMTPAGWNSALSAIGSFQLDRILRQSISYAGEKDMKFSDYVKSLPLPEDDLLVAGALTAIHGGISTGSSIMGSILRARGVPDEEAAATTSQMSASEKEDFNNANLNMPRSTYPVLSKEPEVVAPAAVTGDLSESEKAPYIDQYEQHLTSIRQQSGDTSMKKPLINYIKGLGGINVDSSMATELDNMGINTKTAPGLLKKAGGAGELDNIAAAEFNQKFGVQAPEDGNGYVDRNWLIEQIGAEATGQRIGSEQKVGEHPFQRVLDNAGLDASKATGADVYAAVGPEPEIKLAGERIGENVTPRDALAIRQYMNENPHLDIEDAVSNYMERQAIQEFADMPAPRRAAMLDSQRNDDPAQQILSSQISAEQQATPPPINGGQSGFNTGWRLWRDTKLKSLYAELINDLQPIEDLTGKARAEGAKVPEGQDTALTVSLVRSTPEWIRRNQMVNTTTWDNEGNQVVTGKGLKVIYDDFDNKFVTMEPDLKKRHQDFDDYLKAKSLMEDKAAGSAMVTPEQEAKSRADLARIAEKYGEEARFFDTFAQEIRDWDNRILHNLVTSGLKTQQWYDDTVAARVHYSPLRRVVQEEFGNSSVARSGIGKDVTPSRIGSLKQRKGSELEIKNTFQSRLHNSAVILQKSMVNKLRRDIAQFAKFYPEDVVVKRPAILREAVQHDYDPKLREKLEQLVDFLGGDVERSKKVGGKKTVLGSYSPSEKLVRLRIGSTEGTLAHEAGHMLDDVLDLKRRMLTQEGVRGELQKLAEDRIGAEHEIVKNPDGITHFEEERNIAPKKYHDYIKNDDEIIANFYDAYVNSPEQAAKTAPKALAAFEKIIDENPQLALLREIKPSTNRATETIEKELLDMRGPRNSIPVYIKGRRHYLELSDPMYKAFSNMRPIDMGMVERFIGGIFRGSKKLLQFGATSTPDFMLRHFYRAVGTSYLNTKGAKPVDFLKHATVSIPKGIFSVIGKTELYHEWASSSGGLRTYMDLSDKALAKMQKDMFSQGSMADMLNPLHAFFTAKEVSDYAPRIAVFEKAKANGASDLAAGLASLEATGNYVRHGSLVKRINQYAPFFNDMVQGGDRFVRSIARDPAAFTIRATALITIPQLIMTGYYLYAADDKTRDEYLNLPDWRRSVSMNIKIGDTWVPLPRYFAPGFVFGALPEKVMLWAYGGNHPELKHFWLRMLAETATSVSPVFDWTRAINPLVKSALESITNYSFFMQRPLFSGDMARTAPGNQYNQYTSETAKVLGKMFNYSPTDIDNTVYDMSAKIGRYATQLSDIGINAARSAAGQPVNQKATRATDNPIYGGLIEETPRGTGTEAYAEFREHFKDAAQTRNELRDLKGPEAAAFQHDHAHELAAYPPINAMQTQVNHLLHQQKLINQNTNISGDDKTKQINALSDQITRLVEGANMRYRAATKQK